MGRVFLQESLRNAAQEAKRFLSPQGQGYCGFQKPLPARGCGEQRCCCVYMQPQPAAAFGLCIWWVQGHAPCPEIMHKHFVLAWLGRPAGCWRCKIKRAVWFLAFLASTGAPRHWAGCKDEHQHFPYLHVHLGKSVAAVLNKLKILQNNGAKGRRQTVPACHSKAWSKKAPPTPKPQGR